MSKSQHLMDLIEGSGHIHHHRRRRRHHPRTPSRHTTLGEIAQTYRLPPTAQQASNNVVIIFHLTTKSTKDHEGPER